MERKTARTVRDEIAFILVDYMDNRTTALFLFLIQAFFLLELNSSVVFWTITVCLLHMLMCTGSLMVWVSMAEELL